jgi:hypothetical protein
MRIGRGISARALGAAAAALRAGNSAPVGSGTYGGSAAVPKENHRFYDHDLPRAPEKRRRQTDRHRLLADERRQHYFVFRRQIGERERRFH